MADLVEFVINGILKQEQMQQRASQSRPVQSTSFHVNQANLSTGGSQLPASLKQRDEALWKVSRQFEAIFVQQMMVEMRKTVNKSDFMPSGYAEDVHASMMDEAIAKASAKRSSFGIADSIYRQLEAAQRHRSDASEQSNQQSSASVQEISNTADKLERSSGLAMEVNRHAY